MPGKDEREKEEKNSRAVRKKITAVLLPSFWIHRLIAHILIIAGESSTGPVRRYKDLACGLGVRLVRKKGTDVTSRPLTGS